MSLKFKRVFFLLRHFLSWKKKLCASITETLVLGVRIEYSSWFSEGEIGELLSANILGALSSMIQTVDTTYLNRRLQLRQHKSPAERRSSGRSQRRWSLPHRRKRLRLKKTKEPAKRLQSKQGSLRRRNTSLVPSRWHLSDPGFQLYPQYDLQLKLSAKISHCTCDWHCFESSGHNFWVWETRENHVFSCLHSSGAVFPGADKKQPRTLIWFQQEITHECSSRITWKGTCVFSWTGSDSSRFRLWAFTACG